MAPLKPSAPRLFSRNSYASQFEADDERSSTVSFDIDSGRMSPDRSSTGYESGGYGSGEVGGGRSSRSSSVSLPPPRYPGEDTRPTSPKELAGWYAYSFAAEVYVICGQYCLS